MSKLYENAILSIQLGIEDYENDDPRRAISAVRNFYAGILLLAKETLVRSVPDANPDDLLAQIYKPIATEGGGLEYVPVSKVTIDFTTIGKRFADFNLKIDEKALAELNRIRNDLEHKYSERPRQAVLEALAKAFPVVVQLFDQMPNSHATELGAAWDVMLQTHEVFEAEKAACRASFANVEWISETVSNAELVCPECGSSLIRQIDGQNRIQNEMKLYCSSCRETPSVEAVLVSAIENELGGEAYMRAKDTGEDGPVFLCTECDNEAYIDFESKCAICGHSYESERCARCHCQIPLSDIIAGEDDGLCGYCRHLAEKVMRE